MNIPYGSIPRIHKAQSLQKSRKGSALVELIVSALLLSVAVSACLSLLNASGLFADRINQLANARTLTRNISEQTHLIPCAISDGNSTLKRSVAQWSVQSNAPRITSRVYLTITPAHSSSSFQFSTSTGAWCR